MPSAFIGLGANLGNPAEQLQWALAAINQLPKTQIMATSNFYRSAALGPAEQPDYCNAVAEIRTELSPKVLLDALLSIETLAGRIRAERWAARVLDLDILLYDQLIIDTEFLSLPHPELTKRAFVLVPLEEIAPDLQIPHAGMVGALCAAIAPMGLEIWR